MVRIRANLSPKTHDVSETKVFISYKSEDWDYARSIREGLVGIGFQAIIVPPAPPYLADDLEGSRRKLYDLIDDSDYLCLISTHDSLKSDWVSFEFKEAAALMGRVVFVCKDTPISGYEAVNSLGSGDLWRQLFIKHTTLSIPEITEHAIEALGIELINDPHEGWYDGRGTILKRMPNRGLRQQSRMKQCVRKCVLIDHKYRNELVLDVIPFTWSELDCAPGDIEAALKNLILSSGRLHLEEEFLKDEVDIFHTWYYVTGEFLTEKDSGLDVFVVLEHRERSA